MEFTYPIDYSLYDIEEITNLIEFLDFIEEANNIKIDVSKLSILYKRYKSIINSISEEKRIDKEYKKLTGVSVYDTLKKYGIK